MPKDKPQALLAFAPKYFSAPLKSYLVDKGFEVAHIAQGPAPKKRYDVVIQAAREPADLAEWTRDLLDKSQKDRSRFFLICFRTEDRLYEEACRFARSLVSEYAGRRGVVASVLNLARIYGPQIPAEESGSLGHLIREFAKQDFLTVYGEGKESDYYLYIDDAARGAAMAAANPTPAPEIAISAGPAVTAEAISKILFELGGGRHEIRYHRGIATEGPRGTVEGEKLDGFSPAVSLKEGILSQLKLETPPKKAGLKMPQLPAPRLPKIRKEIKPLTQRQKMFLGIAAVVLLPVLYISIEAGAAFYSLVKAKSFVSRFDLPAAEKSLKRAEGNFRRLKAIIPPIQVGETLAGAGAEVMREGDTLSRLISNIMKSYQGEPTTPQTRQEFEDLASSLNSASRDLTVAWLDINQLPRPLREALAPFADTIQKEALPALSLAEAFASQAYDLLGYSGERNYLLLFQNSAELQPAGGRMGTFAKLTLNQGSIKELKFFDESDFSHISSPLGKAGAVSKKVDFQDAAKSIADIFLKGDGKQVQGVIGVDLRVAQSLLGLTGPITLADFDNQEVTAENFFEVTTREVETEFFPGTTKKKRFIQALGEGVLNKFFTAGEGKYTALAKITWEKLEEKGLLLYFTNPAVYLSAMENNFAGRVREAEKDYLYPFDHNSGTKGTVWVKRSINYRVYNSTREGAMRAELTITWKNEGTEAWPGGNYRNKTSLLIPLGSKLAEAAQDGNDVLRNFSAEAFKGKTLLSLPYDVNTYVTVPPQGSQTLTFVYDLPEGLNLKKSADYSLLVQKQPGTAADEFKFVFEIPLGWEVSSSNLQKSDNQLIFEGNLDSDLEFKIALKER